jgi:outer membrane protein OmpA-like peptidoglycan-associated protein
MRRGWSIVVAGWLWVTGVAHAAPAFDPKEPRVEYSRFRARASLLGATLLSEDQVGKLGYDGFGLLVDGTLGFAVLPWLEPQLSVLAGAFPSTQRPTGGLIAPLLGLAVGSAGPALRVYGYAEAGPGFTGTLTRPLLRLGAGLDFRVLYWLTLGPALGYAQLFQDNRQGSSTDARMFYFGLSFTFRPARVVPPAPRVFRKTEFAHDVVVVHERAPAAEPSPELMALIDGAVPAARVELLAPVLFKFDSDELEPVGVAMLHEVARELGRRPDIELLEVQGYADRRGSDAYNDALSLRRAERVRSWLVERGVAAGRLQVAARGASDPVEAGEREVDHEQNRRMVFRVVRARER